MTLKKLFQLPVLILVLDIHLALSQSSSGVEARLTNDKRPAAGSVGDVSGKVELLPSTEATQAKTQDRANDLLDGLPQAAILNEKLTHKPTAEELDFLIHFHDVSDSDLDMILDHAPSAREK